DPMATGVLVLGINNGTKFLQYITEGKKRYLGTIRLGQSTITDDREGSVIETHDCSAISDEAIRLQLQSQVGTIMQKPSKVSAKKIGGERAYDLVREGKEVDLPAREVTIYSIEILEIRHLTFVDIDIDVECSSGTYIRSIARDLGDALKVGGHLTALRRTQVDPFTLDDATSIEDSRVLPLALTIGALMPVREIDLMERNELTFGRALARSTFDGPGVAIAPDGEVAAIIENREHGAQPLTVFVS
ncbi:MAG: tRNA pseudouridine(55) synthase TruB, partial [Actinobacteria bacterium]|nr:tRNA pseudouridine(55) synthase TruB [Actinomycetota bacterium]